MYILFHKTSLKKYSKLVHIEYCWVDILEKSYQYTGRTLYITLHCPNLDLKVLSYSSFNINLSILEMPKNTFDNSGKCNFGLCWSLSKLFLFSALTSHAHTPSPTPHQTSLYDAHWIFDIPRFDTGNLTFPHVETVLFLTLNFSLLKVPFGGKIFSTFSQNFPRRRRRRRTGYLYTVKLKTKLRVFKFKKKSTKKSESMVYLVKKPTISQQFAIWVDAPITIYTIF